MASKLQAKVKKSWETVALTDASIGRWWKEMRKSEKLPKNYSIIKFMKRGMKSPSGYNYKSAIESGMRPSMSLDTMTMKWGGRTKKGKVVKGKDHPTRWKTDQDKAK